MKYDIEPGEIFELPSDQKLYSKQVNASFQFKAGEKLEFVEVIAEGALDMLYVFTVPGFKKLTFLFSPVALLTIFGRDYMTEYEFVDDCIDETALNKAMWAFHNKGDKAHYRNFLRAYYRHVKRD